MEWGKTLGVIFFSLQLKLFSCCGFSFTSARTHMALFIRWLLPVMSSSKQNSRWCGWHPGNSVESCNGAAALQQLRLWSHKSDLNRGRECRVKLKDMCYLSGIVSSCILLVNLLKKNVLRPISSKRTFIWPEFVMVLMVDADSEPMLLSEQPLKHGDIYIGKHS